MSVVLTPPPAPASSSSKRLRHKTLSAYYPLLQTLREYLVSTIRCPLTQLLHPDDPEGYTELLDTAICAVLSETPVWNGMAGRWGDVDGTQQEAIDRIMREVARSVTRDHRDVLLSGSRVRRIISSPLRCWCWVLGCASLIPYSLPDLLGRPPNQHQPPDDREPTCQLPLLRPPYIGMEDPALSSR
jgi:hypothetical protein